LAGLDQGLKPQWCSIGIMSRVIFSCRELSHGEAEEIESEVPFMWMAGMRDSDFTGV
jgi:hypothetical protein